MTGVDTIRGKREKAKAGIRSRRLDEEFYGAPTAAG
jgi:hypothetical protein